jgi:NADPH:quinone reductase-like Zn-dependent oxidoreductase
MMKALCVTPNRMLELRDISRPKNPAPGHVVVDMFGSAINHGDKTFLSAPGAAGGAFSLGRDDVWGASGSGRVTAMGAGVPSRYLGKQVAIYRSLRRTPESVGLWCETAHVPYTGCLVLPDHVRAEDCCGSLVNVMTAHAFLNEITEAGHRAVVVTAGNSATGMALGALARKRGMPAILLVRTEAAKAALEASGEPHVLVAQGDFANTLGTLSAALGATVVFDGVGGDLVSSIAPILPPASTIYFYGFLGGGTPVAVTSALFMMKNLTMKRFSNFESATVKDEQNLIASLEYLGGVIEDPAFRTTFGESFPFEQIDAAMAYHSPGGAKAILVAG